MSVSILDNILADDMHSITEEDLSQDEIKHIKAMITSEKDGSSPPKGKRWLYEACFHQLSNHLSPEAVQFLRASVNYTSEVQWRSNKHVKFPCVFHCTSQVHSQYSDCSFPSNGFANDQEHCCRLWPTTAMVWMWTNMITCSGTVSTAM